MKTMLDRIHNIIGFCYFLERIEKGILSPEDIDETVYRYSKDVKDDIAYLTENERYFDKRFEELIKGYADSCKWMGLLSEVIYEMEDYELDDEDESDVPF